MSDQKEPEQQPRKKDLEQYLRSVLEHTIAAGRDIRDFNEFALDRLGDSVMPHLRNFLEDVRHGVIEIKGLADNAKTTLLGHHANLEEREHMLREAAYFYWLKNSRRSGSDLDNWLQAEKDIDAYLDRQMGLVKRGTKSVTHMADELSKELKEIKDDMKNWLKQKYKDAA